MNDHTNDLNRKITWLSLWLLERHLTQFNFINKIELINLFSLMLGNIFLSVWPHTSNFTTKVKNKSTIYG
jgi:hypothetical protein